MTDCYCEHCRSNLKIHCYSSTTGDHTPPKLSTRRRRIGNAQEPPTSQLLQGQAPSRTTGARSRTNAKAWANSPGVQCTLPGPCTNRHLCRPTRDLTPPHRLGSECWLQYPLFGGNGTWHLNVCSRGVSAVALARSHSRQITLSDESGE